MIDHYTAATANLFALNDSIAQESGNFAFAALATAQPDLDLAACEMTMLVEAAGGVLSPGAR
jgi:hypothetical protein